MSSSDLNKYLSASKTDISDTSIDLLVMGNEAADLDSMASAITYAYLLAATYEDKTIVPLMPINRADFKLRTEAVYVFAQAGIDLKKLIFMDDVEFEALMNQVAGLVMVDHNRLPVSIEKFEDKVAIIIDHHRDEGLYRASQKVISPVGSCATLVGEEMIRDNPDLVDEAISLLLGGTILLDTVNLNPGAGRVTPADEKIAAVFLKSCPFDRDSYFKKIHKAKFNTDGLNTYDLLRKDYKEFQFSNHACGIASVLLPLSEWAERDNKLCCGFESWAQTCRIDILLSMNAFTDQTFNRELAVYCKSAGLHDIVLSFLQEKGLALTPIRLENQKSCRKGRISFYRQNNSGISRKKLVPLLENCFMM